MTTPIPAKGRPTKRITPNTKAEPVKNEALVETVVDRTRTTTYVKRERQPIQVVDFYRSRPC